MIIPDTEAGLNVAVNTGCNINGYEMWIGVPGAHALPETYDICENDDTVVDSWGDSCSDWYDDKPETCGDYDTDTFTASMSCCACHWLALKTEASEFTPTMDYM